MTLNELLVAAEFKISGGGTYEWVSFGPNVRFITFSDDYSNEFGQAVFDTKTFEVYQINVTHSPKDFAVQWVDPIYWEAYAQECADHNCDPLDAWDVVQYRNVSASDMLEIISHFSNRKYTIMDKYNGKD